MDGSENQLWSPSDSINNTSTVTTNEHILIQVRAQIMIKDEPTGLWRGLKSNPLAVVTLRQIDNKDYSIVGVRLGDKMELLNSKLLPGTQYQQGDATFHHWTSDNTPPHGLAFSNMGDARKFERLVRNALHEINPPRGSLSEEEIFVKTDILTGMDASIPPAVVPLRPHKPKRLTEEYRTSSDSSMTVGRTKNSSSSEDDVKPSSRRGSPLAVPAGPLVLVPIREPINGASNMGGTPPLSIRSTTTTRSHSTGSLSQSPTMTTSTTLPQSAMTSHHPPTCTSTPGPSHERTIATKSCVSERSGLLSSMGSERPAVSNIYVQRVIGGEPLPRRSPITSTTSAGGATAIIKPTPLPVIPKREQYSDYRNDYYIKTEKKATVTHKAIVAPASDNTSLDILTHNTDSSEDLSECNLKSIKNTPPLPRKKKRHRPTNSSMCCFSGRSGDLSSDETV